MLYLANCDDILDANHVYLTINREDDSLIVP